MVPYGPSDASWLHLHRNSKHQSFTSSWPRSDLHTVRAAACRGNWFLHLASSSLLKFPHLMVSLWTAARSKNVLTNNSEVYHTLSLNRLVCSESKCHFLDNQERSDLCHKDFWLHLKFQCYFCNLRR